MNKKILKLFTFFGAAAMAGSLAACGGSKKKDDPKPSPSGEPTQPASSPAEPTSPVAPTSEPVEPTSPVAPITEPVEPTTSPVAPTSEPASTDPGVTTKVEIDFWQQFGQGILNRVNPQIEKFIELVKKNDNVDLKVNMVPNSNYDTLRDEVLKGLPVGQIPTLAVAYPDHVADYIHAEQGEDGKYVVNLDQFINSDKYGFGKEPAYGEDEDDSIDDFVEAYIDEGRHFAREGTYTFPYLKSSEAMLYNYEAVEAVLAHYKPEFNGAKNKIQEYMNNLTWNEFMNLCEQTWTYRDEINKDLKYPAFYDSDGNLFISQMYQSEISYSSIVDKADGSGKIGHIDFADGQARTDTESMLNSLKAYYDKHLFTTKGCFSTYGSDSFKNIESVFTIGSTGGSGYSLTSEFEIGVCKVPYLNNNPLYVSQGPSLVIMNNPSLSKQTNELRQLYAWKLVKYLTNTVNNVTVALRGSEGYSPVRYSCYETDLYLDFQDSGEFQAEIYNVVSDEINGHFLSTPCFPGSAELRKQCGGALTDILSGDGKAATTTSILNTAIDNARLQIK